MSILQRYYFSARHLAYAVAILIVATSVSLVFFASKSYGEAPLSVTPAAAGQINVQLDNANPCPDGGGSAGIAQTDWISPSKTSNLPTVDVPYGTTQFYLTINYISFACDGLRTGAYAGPNSPDYTDALGLVGDIQTDTSRVVRATAYQLDPVRSSATDGTLDFPEGTQGQITPAPNTRYWPLQINFRYTSSTGPLTSNKNINVILNGAAINEFRGGGSFACIGVGHPGTPSSLYDFAGKCNNGPSPYTAVIRVFNLPYNLIPKVNVGNSVAYPGNGVSFTHATESSGAIDRDVGFSIYDVILRPGSTKDTMGVQDNVADVCASFAEPGATCSQADTASIPGGNITAGTQSGWFSDPGQSTIMPPNNAPIGTKVCRVFAVDPAQRTGGSPGDIIVNKRVSAPRCAVIAKKPKVQIHGGDIRIRGNIDTATSSANGMTYGSWVEYGAFSTLGNNGFASGSGWNNGTPGAFGAVSKLTFANIDDGGAPRYGYYAFSDAPSLVNQFTTAASAGTVGGSLDLNTLASGTYKAGDVTITPSPIGQVGGKGKSIVIVADGTVTIAGDITYAAPNPDGTFTNMEELPQVIIIAHTIKIAGSVGQIDSWLLTTGTMADQGSINTCSDVSLATDLTASICKNKLIVNGPVSTSKLHLRRTAGSDTAAQAGDPAEVFNLRPDAYLWGVRQASAAGKAQTTYSVELPPRY